MDPFPTVLVHPDGSATATDMRGVLLDLASRGYLAVAADYRRRRDGVYRRTLFPWCPEAESTAILEGLSAHPWVDTQRLAALGFSQGACLAYCLPPSPRWSRPLLPITRSLICRDGWRRPTPSSCNGWSSTLFGSIFVMTRKAVLRCP